MGKFNVGDRIRVSENNTYQTEYNGREGVLLKVDNGPIPYEVDFGNCHRWVDSVELITETKQNSPSKDVIMKTKTIYQVIAVNKKTGLTEKNTTISADNEQQAILKTFGVDAENTFIKVTEVGSYEEDKPLKAIIEKPTK